MQVEKRSAGTPSDKIKLGNLRVQKDHDKNEVHVHDGKLYFRFEGIDRFLDLWDVFWKNAPAMAARKAPRPVVFKGKTDDPGGGRTACDLCFEFENGDWSPSLLPCSSKNVWERYDMTSDAVVKMNYFLKYGVT